MGDEQQKDIKNNILQGITTPISKSSSSRKIPPLDKWTPKQTHPFDIHICHQGFWWHEGSKMTRQSLIDLFASVLWCEVDEHGQKQHFLKTPTDKYQITVADVPLFINQVDMVREDGKDWLVFTTTHGDKIRLDDEHRLYFRPNPKYANESADDECDDEQLLYIDTRFGLTARIERNVFYHLVQMGRLEQVGDAYCLELDSGGQCHQIMYGAGV